MSIIAPYMTTVITILALGLVIFIHELGHMWAAKKSGIGVLEFSVGMGPKLLSKKWGETLYCLRILPIGGFVKLAGLEDEHDSPPEINFYHKPIRSRFLTIAAGAIMNVILGYVIFVGLFSIYGTAKLTGEIEKIIPDSAAAKIQIQATDVITQVNGHIVNDVMTDVIGVIQNSPDKPVNIVLMRGEDAINTTIVPENKDGKGQIGVYFKSQLTPHGLGDALGLAMTQTGRQIANVFISLKLLITGQVQFKEMAGPIGIIQFASVGLDRGWMQFFGIMAMISISLGIINLLPFPVLDGGHLLLLLLEAIRGKRLSKKWETIIHNVGAALLIALMIAIVFNDIVHWKDRLGMLSKL